MRFDCFDFEAGFKEGLEVCEGKLRIEDTSVKQQIDNLAVLEGVRLRF